MNEVINENFERKQTVFILGKDGEKHVEELKKNLHGLQLEEWNNQNDMKWKDDFEIRVNQKDTDRVNKIVLIRGINEFFLNEELTRFLTEARRFNCWWWIVSESLAGINNELLTIISGSAQKVIIGEIGESDIEKATKFGWIQS